MRTEKRPVYITADEREFFDSKEARAHERELKIESLLFEHVSLKERDCKEVSAFIDKHWDELRTIMEAVRS